MKKTLLFSCLLTLSGCQLTNTVSEQAPEPTNEPLIASETDCDHHKSEERDTFGCEIANEGVIPVIHPVDDVEIPLTTAGEQAEPGSRRTTRATNPR